MPRTKRAKSSKTTSEDQIREELMEFEREMNMKITELNDLLDNLKLQYGGKQSQASNNRSNPLVNELNARRQREAEKGEKRGLVFRIPKRKSAPSSPLPSPPPPSVPPTPLSPSPHFFLQSEIKEEEEEDEEDESSIFISQFFKTSLPSPPPLSQQLPPPSQPLFSEPIYYQPMDTFSHSTFQPSMIFQSPPALPPSVPSSFPLCLPPSLQYYQAPTVLPLYVSSFPPPTSANGSFTTSAPPLEPTPISFSHPPSTPYSTVSSLSAPSYSLFAPSYSSLSTTSSPLPLSCLDWDLSDPLFYELIDKIPF